jgi:two-component system phosphate regulon response regulator PhoB
VPTILVVDDDPKLRRLVALALSIGGLTVLEAGDADAAWELLVRHRPAPVLLDVSMPGRSGLELARDIKADPELAATRVVILSALAHEAEREAGLAAGADLYLTKPFFPSRLLATIERSLAEPPP